MRIFKLGSLSLSSLFSSRERSATESISLLPFFVFERGGEWFSIG